MKTLTFRLRLGQDLADSITQFSSLHNIQAACILSGVNSSLPRLSFALVNQDQYDQYQEHFEIVLMTGTVSVSGSHLHIAISDERCQTIGGHLVSGYKIYSTAEIVIVVFSDLIYTREPCLEPGYDKLVIMKR